MSQTSTATLGNNKIPCPVCNETITGKHLFNHFCTKHEKQVLAQNTKEGIQEAIDSKQPFMAYNEDAIVSQGCLGCKKGFSNLHKATTHFQQQPECLKKHVAELNTWKTIAKKGGKYSKAELVSYQKTHARYKPTDDTDKNRCGYLFLAEQLQGLDIYLAKSIKQMGFVNREFEMAVKILEKINTQLQVKDVQEIYTTDWYRLCCRAWNWITMIQEKYFHTTYHWDYLKYTPFPMPCSDPEQKELDLYLNGDVETYTWNPIDLQSMKQYNEILNPPNADEIFKRAYEEDMRRMNEQHQQMIRDKVEMEKRYKALEERAVMYEGSEEEEEPEH